MAKKRTLTLDDRSTVLYDLHEYGINEITRELFLHRYIHTEAETAGDCGVDYRMAVTFIKNLGFLDGSKENILVHMQSRGGDWNDGIAVYDAIKASVAPVTILAYAHARSMTSIILQAADVRVLMPNCDFVVHYGWTSRGEDRFTPVMNQMEHEKRLNEVMLKIYAARCKGSEFFVDEPKTGIMSYIKMQLADKTDWILSAKEAVMYGFADGVLGTKGFETIKKIRGM